MQKLYCYSYNEFERLKQCKLFNDENTAVISISSLNEENICGHVFPNSDRVLNLDFDDVSLEEWEGEVPDNIVVFNQDLADKAYNFIKDNITKDFVIHCNAGVSRSQGFICFISTAFPDHLWETRKENPCVVPNMHVVKMLMRALYKDLYGDDITL